MAINTRLQLPIVENTAQAQPEGAVCEESSDAQALPSLVEWRASAAGALATPQPRHAGAERADQIPREYALMSQAELDERIARARATLGARLVILGHHYQRDEIIKYADARGDSFKLAQFAATKKEADYIVFCGVHFMAESADILSEERQRVVLPNPAAGCSMADMANIAEVEELWEILDDLYRDEVSDASDVGEGAPQPVIPITYMNSAANLKAFCGRNGGIVCTSSNAQQVMEWAFARGRRVLFFPDEHLGRNTALKMGIAPERIVVWNQRKDFGDIADEQTLIDAQVILWKGWCSTHQRFSAEQIAEARERFPGVRVVVHPECNHETVMAADLNGSTEYIIKVVEESPAGAVWAIGTEINLVKRLAREHPDKTIFCLDPIVCPCSTMYRIHPAYLAWVLEELVEGRIVNQVSVDGETARWAKVALERMLATKGK
ncbi:MAG TPA: quinolinate synthase NadA [Ktedonobacterales bacterium]|jgi:quinolinate synthase|nr:quinolinate synthase NadA [Ktedonobacterales bacterium]